MSILGLSWIEILRIIRGKRAKNSEKLKNSKKNFKQHFLTTLDPHTLWLKGKLGFVSLHCFSAVGLAIVFFNKYSLQIYIFIEFFGVL